MTGSDQPEEDGYELALPFVTVVSEGGPHEDDAYAAGFEMGRLDEQLRTLANTAAGRPLTLRTLMHSVNLPQADLIAMRYDMTTKVVNSGVCEESEGYWAEVEFVHIPPAAVAP